MTGNLESSDQLHRFTYRSSLTAVTHSSEDEDESQPRPIDTDSSDKSSLALPEPRQQHQPLPKTDIAEDQSFSMASTRTMDEDDLDYVDYERLYYTAIECTRVVASVKGVLPKWLDATLFLNGPGLFDINGNEYNHLFDPLALVQKFRIRDGEVEYSSQFLGSEVLERNRQAKQIVRSEFGTNSKHTSASSSQEKQAPKGVWSKLWTKHLSQDNCSSGLFLLGARLFAAGRQSSIVELNTDTLAVEAKLHFGPDFQALTPQWHTDRDGNAYAIATRHEHYFILQLNPKGEITTSEKPTASTSDNDKSANADNTTILGDGIAFGVDASSPCFLSCFGRTKRTEEGEDNSGGHFVFVENPLTLRNWRWRLRRFTGATLADCLQWEHEKRSVFHVSDKDGRQLPINYHTAPLFNFHMINCFEYDDCIVVDLCTYRDSSILHSLAVKKLREGIFMNYSDRAQMKRFVLPLSLGKASTGDNLLAGFRIDGQKVRCRAVLQNNGSVECFPEAPTDKCFELPSVHPAYVGRPYRYCYGTEMPFDGSALMGSKVIKVDTKHRQTTEWRRESVHQFIGKAVFVPSPGIGAPEDRGVLLVPVSSVRLGEPSFLLCLDAQTLAEIGRAELYFMLPYAYSALQL